MEIDLDSTGQVTVILPSKNFLINVIKCVNTMYILTLIEVN